MLLPSFYAARAANFLQDAMQAEKMVRQYAWLRLLVILLAIGSYFVFPLHSFLVVLATCLAGFVILMRLQLAQEALRKRFTLLHQLNLKEEKSLLFTAHDFPDGSAFANPHHPYSHDLDLFGPGSVFQYINRCATSLGEARLAHDLTGTSTHNAAKETLQRRQEAVRELAPLVEFRQQAWALGRQVDDATLNHTALNSWLAGKAFIINKPVLQVLRWVLPAITLLALLATIFNGSFYPFFLALTLLQLALAGNYSRAITTLQKQLDHVTKTLANYSRLFDLLAQQTVDSPLMKKHYATAKAAQANVKTFSALVNALESRMNFIAMAFGNALFLYDLHNVSRLERWRNNHGAELPGWLASLAEWDALLSPATLHANYPGYAFAEVSSANVFALENAGHLLIAPGVRVSNTFQAGKPETVWLITGANMAGKSTFLRALGVNFVLGQLGSPVCATACTMPLVTLRTGMRTTDSLQDHRSYFFAELNRLQAIMEELRSGKPMLILLDEILKGTNSTDKQLGSRELLKQLKDLNALVVLATHDIALGDLQEMYPQQVANACFEGKIENDQLTFDYTLHAGVAQKANATFLMRKMGIIP